MKEKRELLFYFLSFILASWGIGNIFYFEIYLNYPPCFICKIHRALYVALFLITIIGFVKRARYFVMGILLIILAEILVSFVQISNLICFDGLCRFITLIDKTNMVLASIIFIFLLFSLNGKMGIKK